MLSSSINLQWPPFIQRAASDILTDYGPFDFGARRVRTRTPGGVGAGGETPPATRLMGQMVALRLTYLRRALLIRGDGPPTGGPFAGLTGAGGRAGKRSLAVWGPG